VQASSIGPVVAGLMQLRDLLRHNLIRAGEGASALTQDRLASLIEKGQHGLRGILPSESLEPAARARRYDASLLFLIYPLAVVDQTMADRICQDVEIHLQGAFGIRRYRGDSYWTQDYKDKIPAGERTADFSDRQEERDALAVPGKEAQWCIFDPILSAIWGQRYERTRSQDDLDRQTFYFNRSLGQITGSSCPQGALKCPEAYYVEHGRYVPNDHAPLLWTQANLLTALLWMKKSASPPVNR
jgi:phosphorylase kinase alpha/beta subunit